MKKLIFFGVLGLFILASCNSTVTHTHNEHDHEAEGHNHATEDHDHSAHGDESGEGHSHETAGSHLETTEAHSDEIILPKGNWHTTEISPRYSNLENAFP